MAIVAPAALIMLAGELPRSFLLLTLHVLVLDSLTGAAIGLAQALCLRSWLPGRWWWWAVASGLGPLPAGVIARIVQLPIMLLLGLFDAPLLAFSGVGALFRWASWSIVVGVLEAFVLQGRVRNPGSWALLQSAAYFPAYFLAWFALSYGGRTLFGAALDGGALLSAIGSGLAIRYVLRQAPIGISREGLA